MCIKMASKRWNMTFVVSTNFLHNDEKSLGVIGDNSDKLKHLTSQENGLLTQQKILNFKFLKNFQIFMRFGWICKLKSMCLKMASKSWKMACVVSKSISKFRTQGYTKFWDDWRRIKTAYLSGKWTFDATKKLKIFQIFMNFEFISKLEIGMKQVQT